jgi:hypothetical protein
MSPRDPPLDQPTAEALTTSRDDFLLSVKRGIALRVGYRCSRPTCRAPTTGPQNDPRKSVSVGVAAHITAASVGGPRYSASLTPDERSHPDNGIWLCQNCAKLVDNDPAQFLADDLKEWKAEAEREALASVGKATARSHRRLRGDAAVQERELVRNLQLKEQMRRDFLAKPSAGDWSSPRRRPYEKFEHREVVVHDTARDVYPNTDPGPRISSWFKVEVWDFYHNGLEVTLDVVRGVIDDDGGWRVLDYGESFDAGRFTEIKMFRIGRIPWRNIVAYDLDGDEYYPFPHLYCRFADDGQPYEAIVYRMITDDFDWPLEPEKEIRPGPPHKSRGAPGRRRRKSRRG